MEEQLTIYNVADWFLVHESMTHKKLQKLLYLCYGYYIASFNSDQNHLKDEIFENDFQAWVHGPVSPKIYNRYRNAGYNYIMKNESSPCIINEKVEKILFLILEKYKNYNGDDLEKISHEQEPWNNARKGLSAIEPCSNLISSIDIYLYFKNNNMFIKSNV